MDYVKHPKLDAPISCMGLGMRQIPGLWDKITNSDVLEIGNQALDWGINHFETADVYGRGASEKLVGEICKRSENHIHITTKIGVNFSQIQYQKDFSPRYLNSAIGKSLERLNKETISILLLHNPPTNVLDDEDIWQCMNQFRTAKKVRMIGVSVNTPDEASKAIANEFVDCVEIPYSVYFQEARYEFLPSTRKRDTFVIAREVLHSGRMTDRFVRGLINDVCDPRYHSDGFSREEMHHFLNRLEPMARCCNLTIPQLAIRFVFSEKDIDCIIIGTTTIEQLHENMIAVSKKLPKNKIEELHQIYDSSDY